MTIDLDELERIGKAALAWREKQPVTAADFEQHYNDAREFEKAILENWLAMIDEIRRLNELLSEEPKLVDMNMDDGIPMFSIKHWATKLVAASFKETLGDAENYVTMEITCDDTPMVVTVQRRWRKSPAQALSELKSRLERAKTCLEYCANSSQAIRKDIRTEAKQLLGAIEQSAG